MYFASDVKTETINWLATLPTAFHLTVNMSAYTCLTDCDFLLNLFLKHLNRRIYKGRYDSGHNFLEGIAMREPTKGLETYHYHIMILNSEGLPDYERMQQLVGNVFRGLKRTRRSRKSYVSNVKLQTYFNFEESNGLEKYVSKEVPFCLQHPEIFFSTAAPLSLTGATFPPVRKTYH